MLEKSHVDLAALPGREREFAHAGTDTAFTCSAAPRIVQGKKTGHARYLTGVTGLPVYRVSPLLCAGSTARYDRRV